MLFSFSYFRINCGWKYPVLDIDHDTGTVGQFPVALTDLELNKNVENLVCLSLKCYNVNKIRTRRTVSRGRVPGANVSADQDLELYSKYRCAKKDLNG